MTDFPIDDVRAQFPAIQARCGPSGLVFLDGPGGTQVCAPAIEAMTRHMREGTANLGGDFATSREAGELVEAAHAAMADLLGGKAEEIAFGPNMTSLTLALSRSLARDWREGDELVVTRLDHDANVAPWLLAARDRGMIVRWLDFDPETGRLDLDALPGLLGGRTRLVAVGWASNSIGTVNDVAAIAAIVRAHSEALLFVDAVQSVPHLETDVAALGCDFLACSPYKFFGPHQGVLWGRAELLDRLEAYKVRPASTQPPARRFETGTPSIEAQAGVLGTIDYFAWLGDRVEPGAATRRERLQRAFRHSQDYENRLGERLIAGLGSIPGVRIWGAQTMAGRVPTFGLTFEGRNSHDVAAALGSRGICAWAGDFYAIESVARLGLADQGGLLRLGLCHYNQADEVDRTVESLREVTGKLAA